MSKKFKDYVRAHCDQTIRTTFASTFIFRGIMQLFPWLFIPGTTGNFVFYPPPGELLIGALGLAFLLIGWKRTFFRILIVWTCSAPLWHRVFFFSFLVREYHEYITTSYWIFSYLTAVTWAFGTGIILALIYNRMMDSLEKKGYITRTIVKKRKKKK